MSVRSTELIGYSVKSLHAKTKRTALTISAIAIGIAMLIILFGLSTGMKEAVNERLNKFGPRSIVIVPIDIQASTMMISLMPTMGKLFEKDFNKVKTIEGIEKIMKVYFGRVSVEYRGDRIGVRIIGVDPEVAQQIVSGIEIDKGRFLNSKDMYAAVVGSEIAKNGFKHEIKVGSIITIENTTFRIVGILKPVGNEILQMDNSIFVPGKAAKELLSYQLMEDEINAIRLVVREGIDVEEVADRIEKILLLSHHVSEEDKDFTVITPKTVSKRVDSILSVVTIFTALISAIALIIGGVGTANTIYMGVIERTREIGTLRAIGMERKDVIKLFLIESVLLAFIGGIVGIVGGVAILLGVNALGIHTAINPEVGIIGLLVSFLVGLIAGYIPANKAGGLSPTTALRYE